MLQKVVFENRFKNNDKILKFIFTKFGENSAVLCSLK